MIKLLGIMSALLSVFNGALFAEDGFSREKVEAKTAALEMSLEDCVAYGLEHAVSVQDAHIDAELTRFDAAIQRAEFDTSVNLRALRDIQDKENDARLTINQKLPAGFDIQVGNNYELDDARSLTGDLSVRISKQILGGGSWLESMQSIKDSLLDITINLNDLRKQERQLIRDVRKDYYNLLRQRKTLSIQQRQLARAESNLKNAEIRDNKLDMTNARVQVANAKLEIIRAQRSIADAEDQLRRTIGLPFYQEVRFGNDFELAIQLIHVQEDIAWSLDNHEDSLNHYLNGERTNRAYKVDRERRLPTLSLEAQALHPEHDDLKYRESWESEVSLNLQWNLGRRSESARFEKARLNVQRWELDGFDIEQARIQSIRDYARRIDASAQNITIQEQRLEVEELQTAIYQDRWENGEIDILEYIRSQESTEQQRIRLFNEKVQYMSLIADYDFIVGR